MFITWCCRAYARRHDGAAEPVHVVPGVHTSTDAQTTSERTLSLHGQVCYPLLTCWAIIIICISARSNIVVHHNINNESIYDC